MHILLFWEWHLSFAYLESLLHEVLLAGRQQELLRYQDTQSSQLQVSTASGIFDLPVNRLDLIDLLQHHGLDFTTDNHSPLASKDSLTVHHHEARPHFLTLLPQAQPLTSVHETDQSQRDRQHATWGNINTGLHRSQYYAFSTHCLCLEQHQVIWFVPLILFCNKIHCQYLDCF